LKLRLSGDAVDGGDQSSELQIYFGRLDRGLGSLDLSLGCFHRGNCGEVVLNGVIEVLLAGGLLFCQRRITVYVKLRATLHCYCIGERGLRLRQLALGLVERRLKRARIDFEEQLTLLDGRTLLITLLQNVAGNLCAHIGIHQSVERADPFAVNGDVLLLDFNHLNIRRDARRPQRAPPWAHRPNDQSSQDQTKHSAYHQRAFHRIVHFFSPTSERCQNDDRRPPRGSKTLRGPRSLLVSDARFLRDCQTSDPPG
jgi:hypothetical protein